MLAALIIVSLLLMIAIAVAVVSFRRMSELRMDLTSAVLSRTEIANFLSRFSTGINCEDGVDGAMYSTARYVCEQIEATGVAIYGVNGKVLIPLGVYGNYPLTKKLPGRKQRLLDLLKEEEPIASGSGFLGGVLESRQSELIPLAAMDKRFDIYPNSDKLGSVMATLMIRDGIPAGVICAVNNRMMAGRPFSEAQFSRFKSLANQVLMVHQLVQVYGEISRRERIDQELGFVRQFQLSLLPESNMTLGNFTISARTTSAKEVNGDFYDMIRIDDDRILVMVGDACGKGMPACMMAAMTRSFARSAASNFTTLSKFLREINDNLFRDSDIDRFITLGCCLIDRRGGLIEFARAGHTDMIMHVHGHLRQLSPDGTALGMLPDEDADFDTICLALDSGTSLMLYSDGLNEALNHEKEEFGTDRLTNVFSVACYHHESASAIIDEVLGAVHEFEYEQNDDQTMILIRYN
ncbi:MAG: hypothetical protein E7054_10170 [Lentisphaerae bacterium]|nr:hypothetical protein [Lentisphaerota bacterium]